MKINLDTPTDIADYILYLHQEKRLVGEIQRIVDNIVIADEEARKFVVHQLNKKIPQLPLESETKEPSSTKTKDDISVNLGTGNVSKKNKAANLNKAWSHADINLLFKCIEDNLDMEAIASKLNRSVGGVRHKALALWKMAFVNNTWIHVKR